MNDYAAIADIMSQSTSSDVEELDREIGLYEERLRWLKLLRSHIQDRPAQPIDPVAEVKKIEEQQSVIKRVAKNKNCLEKMLSNMNGEWLSAKQIADKTGVHHCTVYYFLKTNAALFDVRYSGYKAANNKPVFEYLKRATPKPLPPD